jgi:undecaprenyl-diphosphatase
MTLFQSIVLGIIQGITEFLPISSSAHLVLAPYFFGWHFPVVEAFVFDVLVQMGTLLALVIYFRRDLFAMAAAMLRGLIQRQPLADPNARQGWLIVLATVPAGVFGVLIKDQVEAAFSNPISTAVELLITALLLVVAERVGRRNRKMDCLSWVDALWIGAAQAVSIFPGISRSGATIAGGMTRHLDRPSAGRFSFLMSVPVMAAAGLLASLDLASIPSVGEFIPMVAAGFLAAAVVGYLTIHWLLRFLSRHSLTVFAVYCAVLGMATLIVNYAR